MKYYVKYQEEYSRGELLLRAFFGMFYIMIPHGILMMILAIGLMFYRIIAWWTILITGKYPKGAFDYQVKFMRYQLRVNARTSNLADGYPAFGLDGTDENTDFDMPYVEEISRGTLLIRTIFGGLLIFPHAIALIFRMIGAMFAGIIGFWSILFTGKYPKGMFEFVVGTGRWGVRVGNYLNFYTPDYPPFHGNVLPHENKDIADDATGNDEILDDI